MLILRTFCSDVFQYLELVLQRAIFGQDRGDVALVGVLLEHPDLLQYCQCDLDYVAVPGEVYLIISDMGIGRYV